MLDALRNLIVDQWPGLLAAAGTFLAGRWWGRFRARRDYASKEFRDRFNFSLNRLDGDTLRIRTLRECDLDEIFFNSVMRDRLRAVADLTTAQDPILPFEEDERWHYLNVILNEVSEMCSPGLLRADVGAAYDREEYVICLTNEKDGDMRTWKIRAMVVKKANLARVAAMAAADESPEYEVAHHSTRWQTLRHIAARYAEHPEHMMTMEVIV